MNADQKQRAKCALTNWLVDDMAALLQDLIDAPEVDPVAKVTGYYGGYLSISTIDGRVLPAGTALYLAPPAPSVPDMPLSMEQFGGIVGLARDDASEKAIVYKATNIYGETCYFGVKSTAQAWAKSGNVDEVRLRDLRVVATPAPPESPADLVRDAERLEFLLPVVTGDDSHDAIVRTTAIAAALLQGFSGRAAIDAAIRARGEKGQS